MRFRTFNRFAGASLLALASAAGAQTTPTGSSLEEIIVTARRVEERLQDVPISMTVFNQEQLTNRNVVNAGDLANYTPSLSTNTNFGSQNTSFAIRGFVQDQGTPPSVGVYFADVVALRGASNGLPAGEGAGPGYFFDLQNVQVLKGPQGTLFGRNTTGGAILFVPQKPTSDFGGYVEASGGNYDMRRYQGMLNVPMGDIARFRIAVDHESRDGYLTNHSGIGASDFEDVNYTAIRASLVLDLTSNLENYTIASYSKSDTNGSIGKVVGCSSSLSPANFIGQLGCGQLAREKSLGFGGFYDVESDITRPNSLLEQWQVINTTTWKATDNFTVKNIASYGRLRDDLRTALFGTHFLLPLSPTFTLNIPFAFAQPPPGRDTAHQSTATEELQLQGSLFDQRLTFQTGGYVEISRPLSPVGSQSPVLISCTNVEALQCFDPLGFGAVNLTLGETKLHDAGVYAQSTYSLTSQLKLTGGLRYTWDRQENTSTRRTYTFTPTGAQQPFSPSCTDTSQTATDCTGTLKQHSEAPTWLVNLDYKPVDDILIYVNYKRGYRSGGVFPNGPIGTQIFEPEKVDTYEGGIKTSFNGAVSGTFNVNVFYNDFTNQQLQLPFNAAPGVAATPTTGIQNAGKSRISGAEIEASLKPLEGLVFSASYTYLKTKIVSITNIPINDPRFVPGGKLITPGDPLILSPKNKYTISGDYTLPLSDTIGRISFGATFTHTDKQLVNYVYLDPVVVANFGVDLGTLAARNLLNLNIDWKEIAGSPVDVSLFGSNVTNKKYLTITSGLGSNGVETAPIGEPRMYGARVRYKFGL